MARVYYQSGWTRQFSPFRYSVTNEMGKWLIDVSNHLCGNKSGIGACKTRTILMRMPDLLLWAQLVHAVLVGQRDGQREGRSLDRTVEVPGENVQRWLSDMRYYLFYSYYYRIEICIKLVYIYHNTLLNIYQGVRKVFRVGFPILCTRMGQSNHPMFIFCNFV